MKRLLIVILFQLSICISYAQTVNNIDSTKVYTFEEVDESPKFIGGDKKYIKFMSQNVSYPKQVKKLKISGLVVIKMTIGTDGSTSNFEVLKSLEEHCDQEAIRVAALSSKMWIPGKHNNENVAVSYIMPFRFWGSGAPKR